MDNFDTLLRQWMYNNAYMLVGYDYKTFHNLTLNVYKALQENMSEVRVSDSDIIMICWDVFKNTH